MLPICKPPLTIFSIPKLTYCHSISLLGLASDAAQEASSKTPKSLIIRARKRFLTCKLPSGLRLRYHHRNTTNLPGGPLGTDSRISCRFRFDGVFEPH